ncbi:MAG: SGNH/GDSL hydrolase family protein [Saccharofermentanales bacterium]|jgi:lysophospholipase L1-like esterase
METCNEYRKANYQSDKLEFAGVIMLKLLCIGDSLTYGNVGYSYISFLSENLQIVNKGLNGDTLYGVSNRLKKMLNNRRDDFDLVVLGIGTNDILLPYLKKADFYWKLQMSFRYKIKKYTEDDLEFSSKFETLIKMVYTSGKKAIIFGIPYINLIEFPNDKTIRRNQIIKLICEKYGFDFIDIYKLQTETLPREMKVYSWKWSFLTRILDAIAMTLFLKSKDRIATKRGLVQTVDGVHFSSNTAKLLAKEINGRLLET